MHSYNTNSIHIIDIISKMWNNLFL